MGRHIVPFDGVHVGYGVDQRSFEGRMLLEFCLERELCLSNTWFNREKKSTVTFRLGERRWWSNCWTF